MKILEGGWRSVDQDHCVGAAFEKTTSTTLGPKMGPIVERPSKGNKKKTCPKTEEIANEPLMVRTDTKKFIAGGVFA